MNAIAWLIVRVWLKRVAAWCDRDFDRARGVPRHPVLRRRLDIKRQMRLDAGLTDATGRKTGVGQS